MSTKIYKAWRVPVSKLNEFLERYREWALNGLVKFLKPILEVKVSEKEKDAFLKFFDERFKEIIKKRIGKETGLKELKLAYIFICAYEASKAKNRDGFNFDTALNIWIDGKWAYVIPYLATMLDREVVPFLAEVKATDFSYWDNTDEPEGMAQKEWNRRGKIWNKIALDDWNKTRLEYVVIEGSLSGRGFEELERRLLGKEGQAFLMANYMKKSCPKEEKNRE